MPIHDITRRAPKDTRPHALQTLAALLHTIAAVQIAAAPGILNNLIAAGLLGFAYALARNPVPLPTKDQS